MPLVGQGALVYPTPPSTPSVSEVLMLSLHTSPSHSGDIPPSPYWQLLPLSDSNSWRWGHRQG